MPAHTRTSARYLTDPESAVPDLATAIEVHITDPAVIRDFVAAGLLDAIITTAATAELLGVSEAHLRNLRYRGHGPAAIRRPDSGHVSGYRLSDVRDYLASLSEDEGGAR